MDRLPPAFVISNPRAGSTLLRYILDTHPEVLCPDEMHLGMTAHRLAQLAEGLTDKPAKHPKPASLARARAMIDGLFGEALERTGKRMWCEKSPQNTSHLELLAQVFPDARFLCLHRQCLDVVASYLGVNKYAALMADSHKYVAAYPNFIHAYAASWADKTEAILAHEERHADRCLRVRYEDLIFEPERTTAAIFAFLGVSEAPGILDRVFEVDHPQRVGHGDPHASLASRIRKDTVGKGFELSWNFVGNMAPTLFDRLNAMGERLGYATFERKAPPEQPSYRAKDSGEEIDAVFETLASRVAGLAPQRDGHRFKFIMTADPPVAWLADTSKASLERVAVDAEGDYEVRLAPGTLADIVADRLRPFDAFQAGKLQVETGKDLQPLIGFIRDVIVAPS